MTHDPAQTAAFYDEYGEREWTRFEDGRTSRVSLAVHEHYLRRFVRRGDLVLDAGAGPGRFTISLARLGARIVVADLSPGQLELNRAKVAEAGCEDAVVERVVADVCDLSRFDDGSFHVTVCYGGPLSYVADRAAEALAELARVTCRGGHVLVSVMSLVGTARYLVEIAPAEGEDVVDSVIASGYLPQRATGHPGMRLYRWRELRDLLSPHGTIVTASAAGLLRYAERDLEPGDERAALVERLELELAAEPGALDCGPHILAVLEVPA
jgi:ubiquinone/menaquinone biosynthesis C-methylase UbiE